LGDAVHVHELLLYERVCNEQRKRKKKEEEKKKKGSVTIVTHPPSRALSSRALQMTERRPAAAEAVAMAKGRQVTSS